MESARNAMKKLSINKAKMAPSSLVPHQMVPETLEHLTSFILLHANKEGLFRIGGSAERVRILQDRLSKGDEIPNNQPVQDVCTVLKRWLRKQSLFEKCRRPVNPPETLEDVQTMLSMMTTENLFALKHLCKFLQQIAGRCNENLMDIDNLSSILGESIFSAEVRIKEIVNAEQLKAQTDVAKKSLKILIENADYICGATLESCRTPDQRDRESKKSFTTRMKQYGSSIKNFTIKRSRSLSMEPKADFLPFPMVLQSEERYRLRERKGTITQDTEELMERRHKAIQRRHDQIGHGSRKCGDKENNTPVRGRLLRHTSMEEPQQLEWKLLPREMSSNLHTPANLSLRQINC